MGPRTPAAAVKIAKNRKGLRQPAGAAALLKPGCPKAQQSPQRAHWPEQAVESARAQRAPRRAMGNFLQKAPEGAAAVAAAQPRARLDAAGGTADSAHEQSMSAHTMQSTLRLLIVGQAPIEPWKLVGEPPRGVSRATSLRSLTSMRLTPCPVALPRSWLASAAAGVTIGVEIIAPSSTPSTRRLLDGVAVAVPHRCTRRTG